jgi:DNA-binding response OmpR family regulator
VAKKIVMIDDEPEITSMVSIFLERRGFLTATANSGQEGIALINQLGPDVILLDINMPGMDGFAVLSEIKNSKTTAAIPVIMLSARSDEIAKVSACALSCQDYFTKPFELAALEAKIKEVLRIRG